MFGPKHHNGIAPYPNNAPPNSEEQYMPMDPILQRDLNARELAGIEHSSLLSIVSPRKTRVFYL
jgi:hypothetical protein